MVTRWSAAGGLSDFFGEKVSLKSCVVFLTAIQNAHVPDGNIGDAVVTIFCDNPGGLSVS